MKIKIVDTLPPEDGAMLQALYSRSAASVDDHLEKAQRTGSSRFMENYVVGYNHKSIADCGTTTIYIEGVSLLAAKAIQDWPLYSGQETSTRYIDMAKQPIVDILDGWGGAGTMSGYTSPIFDRWMTFYTSNQARVEQTVRERYPAKADDKPAEYERAVKARVFDTLRGFLPAGITTQLSWHTNLRQAGDHLATLIHHPSSEIRGIAHAVRAALVEQYPSSGFGVGVAGVSAVTGGDTERHRWEAIISQECSYNSVHDFPSTFLTSISDISLNGLHGMFRSRPRGCVLPHFLTDLGQISFGFDLDFGSFRDLQRHRNGVCRMPLLGVERGFEPWYLQQLDEDLAKQARDLIEQQTRAIERLTTNLVDRQYYTALGYRVPCRVTYGLPAAVYVMELRSGKTIHPTLRRVVQERMIQPFKERFPFIPLHVDTDPDDWTVRRGRQTITEKS